MTTLIIDRSRIYNWYNEFGDYEHYKAVIVDEYNLSKSVDRSICRIDLRSLYLCNGGYEIYLLSENSRIDIRIETAFKILHRIQYGR